MSVLDTLRGVPQTLDAALLRRWADAAVELLDVHREEIDRINVFPVADGDTGTNLAFTMRAAADSLARLLREEHEGGAVEAAAALARGALVGARGNSGVILSQVLRGVAEAIADAAGSGDGVQSSGGVQSGGLLCDALRRAEELATAAVAVPMEGTVLTVLRAAGEAAALAETLAAAPAGADASHALAAVAEAACRGAQAALDATPSQLAVLAKAGVVDAGGRGLVLLLEALLAAITGRKVNRAAVTHGVGHGRPARDRESLVAEREGGSMDFDYEVMYLLSGNGDAALTEARIATLRAELAGIGDSVAVVGDGDGLWNVHVHCTDVGAAIEAGVDAGRPHRIAVVRFADQIAEAEAARARALAVAGRFTRERAVLMVIAGAPAAELARGEGASVVNLDPVRPPSAGELSAALAGTRARHVVVLPNDAELTEAAESAASAARRDGQEVVVVPTSSVIQGLAALAVHDPQRRAGDDVVAMAEAAAATRTGAVLIADSEALTWVGRCQPGDVLGLSDGEVVLIESDVVAATSVLADRMLTAGGELLTAMLGAGADDELGAALEVHLRLTHPEVEVVIYRGGQPDYLLLLGVE